jgi:hypothetical protein
MAKIRMRVPDGTDPATRKIGFSRMDEQYRPLEPAVLMTVSEGTVQVDEDDLAQAEGLGYTRVVESEPAPAPEASLQTDAAPPEKSKK